MKKILAVAVLLMSLPVLAYQPFDLPPSGMQLLKGSPKDLINDYAKAIREIWLDARRSARADLDHARANEAIRKAVGEDLDGPGTMCYLWSKVDRKVEQAARILVRTCMAANQPLPTWVTIIRTNATRLKDEACGNDDDGKGGRRPKNLGLRYLEEEEKARQDASYRRQFDAMAQEDWDTLVKVLRGMSGARAPGIPAPEFFRDLERLAPAH